jgi:biopolymer transport protein ExbB
MSVEFNWIGALSDSPILLILFGCSVIALGAALERWLYFRKRGGTPDVTYQRALEKLKSGQLDDATWVCRGDAHPMGVVAAEVLAGAQLRQEDVEERMQIALSQQKLMLERNIGILGSMAAITPLIGLLGTVNGIMRAFGDMAETGSAAPSVVAAGVAEALVTTAAGLVIAVPSVLLYNYFSRRMNVMLTVAENHARNLRALIVERSREQSDQPFDPDRAAVPRPEQDDEAAWSRSEPVETAAV